MGRARGNGPRETVRREVAWCIVDRVPWRPWERRRRWRFVALCGLMYSAGRRAPGRARRGGAARTGGRSRATGRGCGTGGTRRESDEQSVSHDGELADAQSRHEVGRRHQLPAGPQGRHVGAAQTEPPIVYFDASGKIVQSFGQGMIVQATGCAAIVTATSGQATADRSPTTRHRTRIPGLQVQPGGQAAAHARPGRRLEGRARHLRRADRLRASCRTATC